MVAGAQALVLVIETMFLWTEDPVVMLRATSGGSLPSWGTGGAPPGALPQGEQLRAYTALGMQEDSGG